jgi:phosphohistidine phosphatase SixA
MLRHIHLRHRRPGFSDNKRPHSDAGFRQTKLVTQTLCGERPADFEPLAPNRLNLSRHASDVKF